MVSNTLTVATNGSRSLTILAAKPNLPADAGRLPAVDVARGIAVALMILSHGVIGLVDYENFAGYGQIPLHLVTKFASSTFIMVFGIALGVAFLPRVSSPEWPRLRQKLWINAVVVFFWYKVLTVAEMLLLAEPELILATLLYQSFPSFVEILGFYAIALLWVPLILPVWAKTPLFLRLASPVLMALVGLWMSSNLSFGEIPQLQAIFVEHPEYYTWGQFSRGPLILIGLLIGELILLYGREGRTRWRLAAALLAVSMVLFASFAVLAPDIRQALEDVAQNVGKHPPQTLFMLFSMAGAFLILALAVFGGRVLATLLYPLTVIGSNALQAFIFHILVIFVGFRYLLGYWHSVSYEYALTLTLGVILATAIWIKLIGWIKSH